MTKATKKQRQRQVDPLITPTKKTLEQKARREEPAPGVVRDAGAAREPPRTPGPSAEVLDRLWSVVASRRRADPSVSHSARLLQRGTVKVAQKFGEEAVECLIEAIARNRDALIAESADVLYHLIVLWVSMEVTPDEVWDELKRREGISGIAEKAARGKNMPISCGLEPTKIP